MLLRKRPSLGKDVRVQVHDESARQSANNVEAASKLKVGNEIGRGAYGTVHEGVYEGKPVAVKKIHRILVDYARDDPEAF